MRLLGVIVFAHHSFDESPLPRLTQGPSVLHAHLVVGDQPQRRLADVAQW